MPNNREWAVFFWAAVAVAWILWRRDLRTAFRQVVHAALTPKILTPLLVMGAWATGLVLIGRRWELWKPTLTTDTSLWFVTSGLVMFGGSQESATRPHFFRRKATSTLKVTPLVEGYAQLLVLGLPVELALQPVAALLGALSAVASTQHRYRPVRRLINSIATLLGVALFTYVTLGLLTSWRDLDKAELLRQLALPIWLTVGLLPYIYCLGLYMAYELAFLRLRWASESSSPASLRIKVALVLGLRGDARAVAAFVGPWPSRLASATSLTECRRVIRDFWAARTDRSQAES